MHKMRFATYSGCSRQLFTLRFKGFQHRVSGLPERISRVAEMVYVTAVLIGSIALFVGEEGRGRSRSVEKSKSGTFPPRLEIPQGRRDSHFSHRPCDD